MIPKFIRDRIAERVAFCKECPSLRKGINQCKECGCLVYAKAAISNAKCPLGKW